MRLQGLGNYTSNACNDVEAISQHLHSEVRDVLTQTKAREEAEASAMTEATCSALRMPDSTQLHSGPLASACASAKAVACIADRRISTHVHLNMYTDTQMRVACKRTRAPSQHPVHTCRKRFLTAQSLSFQSCKDRSLCRLTSAGCTNGPSVFAPTSARHKAAGRRRGAHAPA